MDTTLMSEYVELHKKIIEKLYRYVEYHYFDANDAPQLLSKNDAVIAGNFARLIKLNVSILQHVCECKGEILMILLRCYIETYVNIKYFLSTDNTVKEAYIKDSLSNEVKFSETIKTNITNRDGNILDIEKRMIDSINKAFSISGYQDKKVSRNYQWKSIKERVKIVVNDKDTFYNGLIGMSSHSIHGKWQDILKYNLFLKENDKFSINIEWTSPQPQLMDCVIWANIDLLDVIKGASEITIDEYKQQLISLISRHEESLKNTHNTSKYIFCHFLHLIYTPTKAKSLLIS